jgi:hypothetical protein
MDRPRRDSGGLARPLGLDFDWSLTNVHGSTAVITGVGRYVELGVFDNVWTVTFDDLGRSARFEMLNTERA